MRRLPRHHRGGRAVTASGPIAKFCEPVRVYLRRRRNQERVHSRESRVDRLGQKDPTRAHVGSVFSESGLSYSGERAYQAPSPFCLLLFLLFLTLLPVLFRGILV